MLRRALLLVPVAVCLAADPVRDAASVITDLAASLTARDAEQFLGHFDRSMAGYDKLSANVRALVRQGETQSYVDVMTNEGDEQSRTLEITWELRLQRENDATATPRPEARVTAKLRKQGKQWRIVSFAPIDFLAP